MLKISCFTHASIRYVLPAVVALCAAAACPAASSPVLTGAPPTSVTSGSTYSFQPGADDTAGRRIKSFWIKNQPKWATFDNATGLLKGTPTSAQVGTYSNILIYGSDGYAWASTPVFSVTVNSSGSTSNSGSASLSWSAPTENTNGTPLTNLAGYYLHYGTSASSLSKVVQMTGAGAHSYTLNSLSKGTWYFGITAYTNTGVQSAMSKVVSASVN